jgi:hypothetical protein
MPVALHLFEEQRLLAVDGAVVGAVVDEHVGLGEVTGGEINLPL